MIFARLIYNEHYDEYHRAVVSCLKQKFPDLQEGHQCDSWVWIIQGKEKIEVDTFYAMRHEVRARQDSQLLRSVIAQLQTQFDVEVLDSPEEDPTDDFSPLD